MSSRHRHGRFAALRLVAATVLCALALQAVPAFARAQSAKVKALLCDPAQPELFSRVQGQTRDLPVQLQLSTGCGDTASLAAARAQPLTAAAAAAVLIWLTARADGGYDIATFEAARHELRVREVAGVREQQALASSAVFEAVALVVRAELSALVGERGAGGGTASAQADAASAAAAAERVAADAKRDVAASAAVSGDEGSAPPAQTPADTQAIGSRVKLLMGLGFALALPSPDYLGTAGNAALGVAWPHLRLGLLGGVDLPSTFSDARARLHLQQRALGVFGQARLLERGRFALFAGVQAQVQWLDRRTLRAQPPLMATAARTLSCLALGAELGLSFWPWDTHALGLQLRVGADVVPAPPRYAYEIAGVRTLALQPGYVQPRVGLGVLLAL